MKRFLLTMAAAIVTFAAQAQWINQNVPYGYEGYINDIEATTPDIVWGNPWNALTASPYTRNFVRTIDGGANWTFGTVSSSPASSLISNIWPIDGDTCYVSMYGTTPAGNGIYKTTNGGTTWAEVGTNMFTAATSFTNVVYFWDAQNGVAMGDPIGTPLKYEIYLTTNYGVTWTAVPAANIPGLANNSEYGITNLFSAASGNIWFGTTYGDVYRSIDQGITWTKSATGFPPYTTTGGTRQDISDITFTDALNGLVVQTTDVGYALKKTTDGGLTWVDVLPSGSFYAGEIDAVPGTTTFVSSGSSNLFGFGTSFSSDNGATWVDIDAGISHTAIDFADANTGYTGEYILAGSAGGAWKFSGVLAPVPCGDPSISAGTSTVNSPFICFGDTLLFNTTGAVAPTDGATHGFSVIVSSGDISGNSDPLNQPGILGGTGVIAANTPIQLINDGTIFPAGIYYFTAVVYGNATGTGNITALTLDPTCTYTGQSIMVNLLVAGDPLCSGTFPDECPVAADVNSLLGGPVNVVMSAGPWDNTAATTGPGDPIVGFECYGEPDGGGANPTLDNTLWYTFTGDGSLYFIEAPNTCAGVTNALDDGDSQISIYSGTCGALTPVACNEDGPNATGVYYPAGLNFQTTAGTVYYMIVDGFNFNGALSTGEFCVEFTRIDTVACGAPQISSGVSTPNFPVVCFDSTFVLTTAGIVAPTVGTTHGFSVLVTSCDVSGNPDPLNAGCTVGGTGVISAGVAPVVINLLNDGTIFPAGIYFFTPLVYGNATGTGNVTALTLDPACTYTGQSVMVELLDAGTPCPNSINEIVAGNATGLTVFPVPVKDVAYFNVNIHAKSQLTISVKDNIGKEVFSQTVNASAGENKLSVDMQKQSTGVYFITITGNEINLVSKFVKE